MEEVHGYICGPRVRDNMTLVLLLNIIGLAMLISGCIWVGTLLGAKVGIAIAVIVVGLILALQTT